MCKAHDVQIDYNTLVLEYVRLPFMFLSFFIFSSLSLEAERGQQLHVVPKKLGLGWYLLMKRMKQDGFEGSRANLK